MSYSRHVTHTFRAGVNMWQDIVGKMKLVGFGWLFSLTRHKCGFLSSSDCCGMPGAALCAAPPSDDDFETRTAHGNVAQIFLKDVIFDVAPSFCITQ